MASEGVAEESSVVYAQSATITEIREIPIKGKSKFLFILEVKWSNGLLSKVWRSYNDFFEFQCRLLDLFPEEAGTSRDCKRIIPFLPGKKVFTKSDMKLAEERRPLIEQYLQELLKLPDKISSSLLVISFFEKKASDPQMFKNHPSMLNSSELQSSSESLLDEESGLLMKRRVKQAHDNISFDGSLDSVPEVSIYGNNSDSNLISDLGEQIN